MKTFLYFLIGFTPLLAKEINVAIQVVDERGTAIPQATCIIQYNQAVGRKNCVITEQTNPQGAYSTRVNSLEGLYIEINKEGYYAARLYDVPSVLDLKQTFQLPRKLNSLPLYVKHYTGNPQEGLDFPKKDEWCGYDLKVGDWVQPLGKGLVADFKMRIHVDEKSLENTYLELEATETQAGFLVVEEPLAYSELKLPHQAPENGYVKSITVKGDEWEKYQGVFLRSRVKLDKEGKIISAHYGKIQGAIAVNRRASVQFTHYFNGTPNDRNLEFSPGQNLLKPSEGKIDPQFEP